MATTLSHFPQPSSPSNSWLPISEAYVIMAETTMAPVDLAPAERPMPVGYRFHPTDQELVGHYLHHKLKADDLSIHDTIPEIGVCKYEPWDLLARAASASAIKFDESQCFFFSPRDYKYSNSNRSNRATLRGFWKVTGRDRKITSKDTNKVIGTKKTLIYYQGRVPHGIKSNWFIHEYHDAQLSPDQETHVLCWLRKDNKKKIKEKSHQLADDETRTINHIMLEFENQVDICMNPKEHSFSNKSSVIQTSSQSNEAIDSMIQIPFESNEDVDSMIQKQISPQSCKATGTMIETPFKLNEDLISSLHTPLSESNSTRTVDSMIQTPLFESNSTIAVDSMIQIPFKSDEALASTIDTVSDESTAIIAVDSTVQTSIKPTIKQDETLTSMIHVQSSEPNFVVETSFDAGESGFGLFDSSEFGFTHLQSPSLDEPGLFKMIQTPLFESNSTITVDSMIQIPFKSDEALASTTDTVPDESIAIIAVDSTVQTSIKPTIKQDETLTSMIHIQSSEPNVVVETSFDAGESDFGLFDSSEFDLTYLQSPSLDERELFKMIQTPLFESNSTITIDSMIQIPFESDEALASTIDTVLDESTAVIAVDSTVQTSIKPTTKQDETLTSMIHIQSSEPNVVVETSFDAGESGFGLFDSSEFDFTYLQSPSLDERELFKMIQTPLFESNSTIAVDSMIQIPSNQMRH